MVDLSEKELKLLIEKHIVEGFEYGKPIKYLCFRNNASKEEFESDLAGLKNLRFIQKQLIESETRYALYFIYSKKRGRVYIITFRDKIRIVTIYPLGRRTLKRYVKKGL